MRETSPLQVVLRPTHQPFFATHQSQDGEIVQFLIHCEKAGFSEATIRTKAKILKVMAKNNVNLESPDEVMLFVARRKEWGKGHKQLAIYAYNEYAKMKGMQWTPPFYRNEPSIPFVPTEKEIEALISGTTKKISTTPQALKETGFRIGELWLCKWTDIDEEKSTIKCKAEKHGNPREIRISVKLINMLNALPKINDYVFGNTSLDNHRWRYDRQKTALAKKLQNPRLKQIHFHTFDTTMPHDFSMRQKACHSLKRNSDIET